MSTYLNFIALAVLVAFPVVEIALLLKVGQYLGFWATLLIVISTAFAGFDICRRTGSSAVMKLISELDRGEPPVASAFDAAIKLIAGLLLVLPGLLTDIIGLVLLIPQTRQFLVRKAAENFRNSSEQTQTHSYDPSVIEGEFERLDERNITPNDANEPRNNHRNRRP